MAQELDLTQLTMKASSVYSEFTYIAKVLNDANTTKEDEKKLVKMATEKYNVCEALFSKIEQEFKDEYTNDEVRYLLQTIAEYRKGMEAFKNIYMNDSEPNA